MERILVAIDFSDASRRALQMALQLARGLRAPLHVVHILSTRAYGIEYTQMLSVLGRGVEEMQAELADFIASETKALQEEGPVLDVSLKVLDGIEHLEILAEAERFGATLIVVGSHGKSRAERLLLGSTTSRVLSRSARSVLVVHAAGQIPPRSILAAIDGTAATRQVLTVARAWAEALGARMEVLHVMPEVPDSALAGFYPDSDLQPDMRAMAEQIRRNVDAVVAACFPPAAAPRLRYRVGSAAAEICTEARDGAFDVVIVGPHATHGILDLGNTAARVAQRCPCSVLVRRPEPPETDLSDEAI